MRSPTTNSAPAPDPFFDWLNVYLLEVARFTPDASHRLPLKQWHLAQPGRRGRCECGKPVEAGKTSCNACRVEMKGRLRAPCTCGRPYFANGKCRSCYFAHYKHKRRLARGGGEMKTHTVIAAIVAATLLSFVVMATGCATIPEPDVESVSVSVAPLLTIENSRTSDAIPPAFYIAGSGRRYLGTVGDQSTEAVPIDRSWFGPDGCAVIVAHFVGLGDWASERVCWREGERIDVKVMPHADQSSAWSHP